MQGIDEWLTGEDESTVAGVGEGARGGGNGGMEGILGLEFGVGTGVSQPASSNVLSY